MKTYRERLADCPTLEVTAGRYVHRVHADEVAREADAEIAALKEELRRLNDCHELLVHHTGIRPSSDGKDFFYMSLRVPADWAETVETPAETLKRAIDAHLNGGEHV